VTDHHGITGRKPEAAVGHKRVHRPGPDEELIEPLTVRIKTAMRITGLAQSTIYRKIAEGELEVVRIGGAGKATMAGRGAGATLIKYASIKKMLGMAPDR
jgi:hypothetical protein